MSVGEWLDSIIIDSAIERGVPLPPSDSSQPQHLPHDDPDHGYVPAMPPQGAETFTPPPFANGEFIPGTAPEPRHDPAVRSSDPAPAQPLWQAYQAAAPRSDERATFSQDNQPAPYPPFAGGEFAEVKERLDSLARKLAEDDGLTEVKDRLESLTQKLAQDDGLAEVRQRLDNLTQQLAQDDGLTEITGRLDNLTQQLESMARLNAAGAPTPPAEQPDPTDQVAEVISRLDRRLDEMVADNRSTRTEIEESLREVNRAVADIGVDALRPRAASTGDTSLDQAMAEIADRQRALDDGSAGPSVGSPAANALPRAQTQNLAGLEQQLRQINEQMGSMRPGIDKAVDLLRDDLAEIGVMLQEAMPRRAIEAIEADMRKLSERIDQSKEAGAGGLSLVGIERGLAEVRDALHMLTPAENLAGLGDTVKVLADKVDLIANNSQDPEAIKQLEGAIVAMRSIVTHVASNDALTSLATEVRALSARVDHLTEAAVSSDVLATLEQRIAKLADALEAHNRDNQNVPHELDKVLSGLSAKLELLQSARTDEMALGHLEDRIGNLVQKLDASDQRLNHLEGIERGIADLVKHLEQQRLPAVARAAETSPEVDTLLRDVTGLKQMERQTQDSLEAVHGALESVVERLATIESDIRDRISQAVSAAVAPKLAAGLPPAPPSEPAPVPMSPAARPASEPLMQELRPAEPKSEQRAATPDPVAPESPKAAEKPPVLSGNPMSPVSSLTAPFDPTTTPLRQSPPAAGERRPIDPNLPPDHPLEPGVSRSRYPGSPAERIAASEAAIGLTKPPVIADPGGKSNFIAAARRAAQAASEAPARPATRTAEAAAPKASASPTMFPSLIRKHARSLIIAASVLAIVLGSINIVANWLADQPEGDKSGHTATSPANGAESNTGEPSTAGRGSQNQKATPAPAVTAPDRQSSLTPMPSFPSPGSLFASSPGVVAAESMSPVAPSEPASPRMAQSTAPTATPLQVATSPASGDQLPEGIGGTLRAAATKGDPAAEFEIGQRLADGRGVPQNLGAAAAWYERAAKQGLAPAQFRLGGFYEKGIGVKKNLDAARRFYELAGEAGNAKALHNLAVLYAEGMDGKPDYQAAANWFRKAAAYGMADSQYNLGVLYARGIGVEQNLVDAYRWFGLAARGGDKESERKRDELASRLDQSSLKAAKQAIEAFKPEAQPDAATQVKIPAGGWEPAAAPTTVHPVNKRRSSTPGVRQEAAIKLDLATIQPRP